MSNAAIIALPNSNLSKILTIDNLWRVFVQMRGEMAPKTRAGYVTYGKKFCEFAREKELTPRTMLEWMQHIQHQGKMGAHKVNHMNTIIRAFMRWLKTMGYIQEDLGEFIPKLNAPAAKESLMFTEEEYEKIKAYATGRAWCQSHLWLCILAYRTGMSLVDCCHLRWCNVKLSETGPSYLTIYRIKTVRFGMKAKCHIPIIPFSDVYKWLVHLRDHVERYPMHNGINDYVMPDAPGLYACRFSTIHQDFKNLFKHAGLTGGQTFRHFRNSFCSNLVNSGTQIALVCQMTGHNNVKTLLRYLKPDARSLQDGLARAFQFALAQNGTGLGSDGLTFDEDES